MPTISDVAKRAGVSKATVSRVVNGISVRDASRRRVLDAIAELGYRPNAQAQSLTSGRTWVVGVLTPSLDSTFYGPILEGIQETLMAYDYNMMVCSTYHRRGNEYTFSKLLWEKRVDGLLMVTPRELTEPPVRALLLETAGERFPVVVADGELAAADISGVWVDNYLGGYLAAQHLIELGHRRIGLMAGIPGAREAQQRQLGYSKAMQDAGLPMEAALQVTAGGYLPEHGRSVVDALLDQEPDAVVAMSDGLAWSVMQRAQERGLHIPDHLSVVGYDDVAFAQLLRPSLTTVQQPLRQLGAVAARKLVKTISGEEPQVTQTTLPVQLVARQSTAPSRRRP